MVKSARTGTSGGERGGVRMTAEQLLYALWVSAEMHWKDLPDEAVVSVGTWHSPVPGWHEQFRAELKLTVGDIRSATAGMTLGSVKLSEEG